MKQTVRQVNGWANRHAGALLLAGLAGVAAYNAWRWHKDKALLAHRGHPEPLPPLATWPQLPTVSVLVAAWDEAGLLGAHIESFLALRYPHKELVLCAGGTDSTYRVAQSYAGLQVTVLEQRPGEGKQRALQRCLPEARGDIIFLTDADCLLDDDAFERTLAPVASGLEQVCTGGSRPLPEQMANPFVIVQDASQLYASLRRPDYAPGLLGRNWAISRALLERSAALEVPAPSGTDYVHAKTLVASGAHIRQVFASRVATAFPTSLLDYYRQQRRWLGNVVIHGLHFRAYGEAMRNLLPSLIGVAMWLTAVVGWLVSPVAVVGWLLASAHLLLSRLRYVRLWQRFAGRRLRPTDYLHVAFYAAVDLGIWALALLQYPFWRRRRW